MSAVQEVEGAKAANKREAKAKAKKVKQFKHHMEVTRTTCSMLGLTLNMVVLFHIYWK